MSTQTDEIARRRTFAIISHPDAGKTTLAEKLLLFGGAIQLAGEPHHEDGNAAVHSVDQCVQQKLENHAHMVALYAL